MEIPSEVRRFVSSSIDSLGALEVLLLLFRTPDNSWTAIQIASELCSSECAAKMHLRKLVEQGIVAHDELGDRFNLSKETTEETWRIIQELEGLYRNRLSSLIDALYPPSASPISDFIDAFKLGKGGGRG